MKVIKASIYCIVISLMVSGCNSKKTKLPQAKFDYGTLTINTTKKDLQADDELTVITRFELNKTMNSGDMTNYFQYQLGKKIKIVMDNDTIAPSLFYYVPLINDMQKEIDSKFRIQKGNFKKRLIIQDSILGFEKVNILIN